ncbi:hypothetical protein [Nitrosomonas sp.]|uniref:hypothetical protein n=1 Tax=Nitrosomonas sp. TaxID=42353 RepID=UPI00271D26AE|nr:hypothetical protein [Nitrosomonas sp.]MDO8895417.1 hypothetical protein [Nitrosomonas sp.]
MLLAKLASALPVSQEWTLALDELEDSGMDLRPRLPLPGERELTGASRGLERTAVPLSEIVVPLKLDPLTVADDSAFLDRIENQINLPNYVKIGLNTLY